MIDNPPVPGIYRHYKGDLYVVLGTARHHETGRVGVVYHPVFPHGDDFTIKWIDNPPYQAN